MHCPSGIGLSRMSKAKLGSRLRRMLSGNVKKPTSRWVHKPIPPRSSAVGVISLSADTGDSMPFGYASENHGRVKEEALGNFAIAVFATSP